MQCHLLLTKAFYSLEEWSVTLLNNYTLTWSYLLKIIFRCCDLIYLLPFLFIKLLQLQFVRSGQPGAAITDSFWTTLLIWHFNATIQQELNEKQRLNLCAVLTSQQSQSLAWLNHSHITLESLGLVIQHSMSLCPYNWQITWPAVQPRPQLDFQILHHIPTVLSEQPGHCSTN